MSNLFQIINKKITGLWKIASLPIGFLTPSPFSAAIFQNLYLDKKGKKGIGNFSLEKWPVPFFYICSWYI
jgi:hypothetical protein